MFKKLWESVKSIFMAIVSGGGTLVENNTIYMKYIPIKTGPECTEFVQVCFYVDSNGDHHQMFSVFGTEHLIEKHFIEHYHEWNKHGGSIDCHEGTEGVTKSLIDRVYTKQIQSMTEGTRFE